MLHREGRREGVQIKRQMRMKKSKPIVQRLVSRGLSKKKKKEKI